MPENTTGKTGTVGDLTAAFLEACGVRAAFGVISIHNMPILDAFARRNSPRFVPARGEAGALNMADAFARVSQGLGVGVTSTGVGAGNAAGSLVEAMTAGSPVLHLTGQIELPWLDRDTGYIHENARQPDLLKAVSKAYFRIWSPDQALGVLQEAVRTALTPPMGPVSVEIPIDVQGGETVIPDELDPVAVPLAAPSDDALDRLADLVLGARRPMLWLGGGARRAATAATQLAEMGIGIVTSVNGRGTVPEDHAMTLGSFNLSPPAEALYETCDLMVVCGSRLRGNETLKYTLSLPERRIRIDADPSMANRAYDSEFFVHGDSLAVLAGLVARLEGRLLDIDPEFAGDVAAARASAIEGMEGNLGEAYAAIGQTIAGAHPAKAPWVRDITLMNSMWGNRLPELSKPWQGVHSLGGAIGQGLSMAVGAAVAAGGKTVLLSGDGGFMLNAGELATAVQEQADIAIVLMNDGGYGVIKNIQDAHYGSRQVYADMRNPDFAALCGSLGLPHTRVADVDGVGPALQQALDIAGPAMVEVDMTAIGAFARPFAGPPARPKK